MTTERKKLHIQTWGCQMNVYDSHRMADVLRPLGYDAVDRPDDADMVILNTCHIREKATDKVFSELGRLREHKVEREQRGKKTIIAVAGCVAQAEGDVITTRAPYVDLVFGPQTFHQLPEMILKATGSVGAARLISTDFAVDEKFDVLPNETSTQGVSAFISIQEGCDKFCTFCVVPYTRGSEYSRPAQQIIDEAKRIVDTGAVDLTLLGQNVNAYHGAGPDGEVWGMGRLCAELAKIDNLKRIRYMTSHPRDMDDELVNAHRDIEKLMPFVHLPVQSGSDKILKAMNRKHTADDYKRIIEKFRSIRPDIAFSSDFIVGFPGETDEDHAATMQLVRDVGYTSAYSFKYSPRPGTPAANMGGLVRDDVMQTRLHELQALIFAESKKLNDALVSKTIPVLFDRFDVARGQVHGRSPYNHPVHADGTASDVGQIRDVHIMSATGSALAGKINP